MKMKFVVASLLLFAFNLGASAQTVSTKPPKDYATAVAPLLTPLEKVLEAAGDPPKEAEHGWIILDEVVQHIRADGSRMIVRHQICKAISQNGAEGCGRDVTSYRLSSQKPHLVLARSIQPDGRRQEVRPDARFLQTPQREADYDLYNDSGELVIIFPNVKPGTLTEYIVVIDETKPRIPGHYSSYFGFQFGWPARFIRATAEMPGGYAARATITPLGRGVPEGKKEKLPKDRQRYTWEMERTAPSESEPSSPAFSQSGPLVRVTTLKDWAEFVEWYRPLAEKRFVLGKKLETEVTRWTEKAASPREILDILHSHAANDVRYVGLEFGSCDIEPHPASEVWEHQYGDCKDKASLLAAMLRFKGIPAHLVLVNTHHLGRVERRSPDYRDFNHAILVADLPDGPVFCDPTVEGSAPGMISPNDADRDVLVISKPERWMRTPPQEAGTFALNFDAKLSATGELSGWATLETKGYFAVQFRSLESTSTRQQLKDRLKGYVEGSWKGASVIDIKTEESKAGQPHRIQAYFIVPPNGSPTLRFPFNPGYLPDLGDGENRVNDAAIWREINATTSTITLPPGFRAANVPQPLNVTHEHGVGSARWNLDGSKLRAALSYQIKSSRLPAAQVKSFMASVNTLRAWLDKPVTLEATDGSEAPAPAAQADALADFPRMPTGAGQLDLVSERYPINGDLKLRRAAYEKTIAFFPKDAEAQFMAKTQIAYIDQREDNHPAAIRLLQGILEAQKGSVPAEDSALAEYLLAISFQETKQEVAALALLDAIVANKQISPFRRAWCQNLRSQLFDAKEPEKALQAAQDGLALEDGDISGLLNRVCLLHARLKQETELRATLEKFIARDTAETAQMMTRLAAVVNAQAAEKPAEAVLLVKVLSPLGKDEAFGKEFASELASARVRAETQGLYTGIQEKLKAWVAAHPGDVPEWKVPDALKTPEDFTQAIDKAAQREDFNYAELTRLSVELLIRFEPGAWYGERLWKAVSYIELLDRKQVAQATPPLMLHLLDLCDATPPLSDPHIEGRFLRALTLKRHGKLEEAGSILRALVEGTQHEPGYNLSAIDRMTENAIARGKPAEALEVWRGVVKHEGYYSVPTSLLKAILLALETGDEKSAFEFLKELKDIKETVIAKSEAVQNIQSFLKFAEDEQAMREWWKHSAKWWPQWQQFEAKHLPKRDEAVPMVPIIPSLQKLGASYHEHASAGRTDAALEILRLMGHAARWQPLMAAELAGMPSVGGAPLEKMIGPFRELTLAIHETGGFTDPDQAATVLLWAAVAHFDGGPAEKAVPLCQEYYQKHGAKTPAGCAILRVWGMASTRCGKELPAVTLAMEELATGAGVVGDNSHLQSVQVLAGLYQKQNLRDKELALLKKEIDSPQNKDAGDTMQALRQRHEMLLEGGDAGEGPALAVKAWLAAHKPAWYDHMRPLDLKDEKAADADSAMASGNKNSLPIPEAVKLCCLVAADEEQPAQRRVMAIRYLGWYTPDIAADLPQFKGWLNAIKEEKSLSRMDRAMTLWLAARKAFWQEMHPALRHALAEPLLEHVHKDVKEELDIIRSYGRVDPHDLDATDAYVKELLKGTLDYLQMECLQRCIKRLAEGGRFEQARAHYKAMGEAKYDEDTGREKSAQQLAALKSINAAKKFHPAHEALKQWFLDSPLANAAPGVQPVPEPFQPEWEVDLPDESRLQLYRQWITAGTWPREELDFWVDLASALPRDEHQVKLALGMLTLALEKAPDDGACGALISRCPSIVDTDDLPTLAALEAVLKPYRARLDAMETQDALRLHDLRMKLRQGAKVDVFATLGTLQTPNRRSHARAIVLTSLISQGDKDGTRRMIEMIEPSQLLGRGMVDDAFHAYRLLGMEDEAELAADQIREYMQRELVLAWMMPHGHNAAPIVHMALQLGEPALVPKAFSDHMLATLRDPHDRLFFQSLTGLLSKDWEQTAHAAAEATRLFPTFYDFYNHLGIATLELGRKEEAVKAFTTFLKFDHNTIEAAKAKERLDKIQKDG